MHQDIEGLPVGTSNDSYDEDFLQRLGASTPHAPSGREADGAVAESGAADPVAPAVAEPAATAEPVEFSSDSADTGPIVVGRTGGAHRAQGQPAPPRRRYRIADPGHSGRLAASNGEQGWPAPAHQHAARPGPAAPGWNAPAPASHWGVEAARVSELRRNRKIPSSRGWRKWLYKTSFHTINVGESADETELRQLIATIKTPIMGSHSVTVVGGKGGAGKTSLTCAVASVFADIRKKDLVLAADTDPAQAANLPDRVAPEASATFADLLGEHGARRNDLSGYVGQNTESGLDVLAGPGRTGAAAALDSATYTQAHHRLEQFYKLLFTDTGVFLDHPVMAGVLERSNALVLVASAVPGGLSGAWTALNWLERAGYERFLPRMVLVINHIRADRRKGRKETAQLVAAMKEKFATRIRSERIFELHFDPHISEDGVLDLNSLAPRTYRELLKIAAGVAGGIGADGRR